MGEDVFLANRGFAVEVSPEVGEALFEVETEKVLYEVESPAAGTVAKLLYPLEAVVPVGLPVAVIAEAGENVAEVAAKYGAGLVINYTYERPKIRPASPPVYERGSAGMASFRSVSICAHVVAGGTCAVRVDGSKLPERSTANPRSTSDR